jgi:Ca2+-binding RTX toxin-like protein
MANITGGTGNDILEGGAGPDHFDGGAGEDAVTYIHSPTGLNIYLINDGSPGPATGDAAGDTYHSIEDIIGSNFDDFIAGDPGDNKLYGMGGNDSM